MSLNTTENEYFSPVPCDCAEGFVSASARQGGDSTPQIRLYAHPIEKGRRVGRCEPIQAILCALTGQNQVLCAIKAELDEVSAALETLLKTGTEEASAPNNRD